jgi:hypothetical protein
VSVPVRLAAFAAGLVACFGIGLGIGAAVGPTDDGAPHPTHTHTVPGHTVPGQMDTGH